MSFRVEGVNVTKLIRSVQIEFGRYHKISVRSTIVRFGNQRGKISGIGPTGVTKDGLV